MTVNEDAPTTVLDLSATFADPDIFTSGDVLTLIIVDNTNPGLFTIASLSGTSLNLDHAGNQNGTATITVRATDLAGAFVEDGFLVTVNSVNDPPTVAALIADVAVNEDAADTVLDLTSTFADVDIVTNGDFLTLHIVGNTNPGLFASASLSGSSLTVDYAADQNGTATITVRATDSAGAFVEDSFLVSVNPVNDPPAVASPIVHVAVNEDATNTVLDLSSTFADVDIPTNGDVLTLNLVSSTNPGLFTSVSL